VGDGEQAGRWREGSRPEAQGFEREIGNAFIAFGFKGRTLDVEIASGMTIGAG
jgi:hypothetical protein